MTRPLISVVVPSYNRAHLLPRAIESIRAQDVVDLEILVVDDGSSDNTPWTLGELALREPRLRWIRHPRNRGEAAARNTGIAEAKGVWIAFLDSDDEWLPGKLGRQIGIATSDPTIDAVVTANYDVSLDGSREFNRAWHFDSPITVTELLTRGCAVGLGTNAMLRRDKALAAGKFDENLRLYVDVDWLCRFLVQARMVALAEPLAIYHKSPMREAKAVIAATKSFLEKNAALIAAMSPRDRRRVAAQFHRSIAASHIAHGERWLYLCRMLRVFANDPLADSGRYLGVLRSFVIARAA